ncbi:MAG: HD domain-containing protein [bacterium]|nr:HD domain-containing protein [bacterium]MDZ4284733.1 HD domain-containing protein [Patescibacteria group bacterium]
MAARKEQLVAEAEAFARTVHANQVRPNRVREPVTSHLREVAELVQRSGGTDEEIAAAWLHDSVEDTPTTLDEIIVEFGIEVGTAVGGMTDPPEFEGFPTLERKTRQAERVRHKNRSIKRVKIADQTSNLRSVAVDPPIAWGKQKCLDYIEGARRIAVVCYGVSTYLDFEFLKAYHRALQAHS